jgi:acyl-coenzyme A thioesterase PaaI-like protein
MSAAIVPEAFSPIDLGSGFSNALGHLYVDRAGKRLGFLCGTDQCNPLGTCHGGAIATFADAQILAVNPGSETRTEHFPTINLSIDFMAHVYAGDWVESEVSVDRRSKSLLFTHALMRTADRLVARSTAIYRVMDWRP